MVNSNAMRFLSANGLLDGSWWKLAIALVQRLAHPFFSFTFFVVLYSSSSHFHEGVCKNSEVEARCGAWAASYSTASK